VQTTKAIPAFRKAAETFQAVAKTLSQRCFISPDVFAEEQEKIFSKQWLLVGHQSQISKPGDYFVAEVAGESLIVVRDKAGEIHGFFNVCRHRGTRLIECKNGQSSAAIQCPYHAWTYGLDGRLLGAPHMDDVPTFNKADYSLHPVDLALWEGFIFVNLADSARLRSEATAQQRSGDFIPLERWFAPLAGRFSLLAQNFAARPCARPRSRFSVFSITSTTTRRTIWLRCSRCFAHSLLDLPRSVISIALKSNSDRTRPLAVLDA
jgi:nitrite reductase/ring-hydroxylating ferredoxin subunit